jgi:hypothetical protein
MEREMIKFIKEISKKETSVFYPLEYNETIQKARELLKLHSEPNVQGSDTTGDEQRTKS